MSISFASSLRSYPGDQRTRRQIFQALGVSFVLTAKDLRIKRHPLLEFFGEHREALDALTAAEKTSLLGRAELGEFEPRKTGSWSTKKTSFSTSVSFGGAEAIIHKPLWITFYALKTGKTFDPAVCMESTELEQQG